MEHAMLFHVKFFYGNLIKMISKLSKKVINFFKKISDTEYVMPSNKKDSQWISEKAISEANEDEFDMNTRVVDKLYKIVHEPFMMPLTLAVTGEWGVGKSSTINLLKLRLKQKKNVYLHLSHYLKENMK